MRSTHFYAGTAWVSTSKPSCRFLQPQWATSVSHLPLIISGSSNPSLRLPASVSPSTGKPPCRREGGHEHRIAHLARALRGFFSDYLPGVRGVSPYTVLSYRDAFVLLLRFLALRHRRGVIGLD